MSNEAALYAILVRQALIQGFLLLFITILFSLGASFGFYLIWTFSKMVDKTNNRFVLFVGVGVFIFCVILFVICLWESVGRLLNPSYYALEKAIEISRLQKIF